MGQIYRQMLSASFGRTFSELAAYCRYTVFNDTTTFIARTGVGITEVLDGPSNTPTGTYEVEADFDTDWGSVFRRFDFEGAIYDGVVDEEVVDISIVPSRTPPIYGPSLNLEARQAKCYVYTMDVYRPADRVSAWSDLPAYSRIAIGIPFQMNATPNDVEPTRAGAQTKAEIFTYDNAHTVAGIDIAHGDGIKITGTPSGGNSLLQGWYHVNGNPEVHGWRANYQAFKMKYGMAPEGQ